MPEHMQSCSASLTYAGDGVRRFLFHYILTADRESGLQNIYIYCKNATRFSGQVRTQDSLVLFSISLRSASNA